MPKPLLLDVLADAGAQADRDIQANALYNLGELFYAGEEFGTVSDPSTAKATWLRLSPWADEENRHVRLAASGIACIDAGTPAAACEPLRCSIEGRRECAVPEAAPPYPSADTNRVPPRLEVGRSPPTEDFYPPAARQEGIEGVTTVRACVGPNGRTSGEPTVITSSGHDSLDEAALRWAARARWTPGTEGGRRIEMCSRFNVRFKLNDSPWRSPEFTPDEQRGPTAHGRGFTGGVPDRGKGGDGRSPVRKGRRYIPEM